MFEGTHGHIYNGESRTAPDPVRLFASAMIIDALQQLRSRDIVDQLDAALWLTSEALPLWAALLNIHADGFEMLTEGRWKNGHLQRR